MVLIPSTSSANAAAFVLVGESAPARHRSRFMFLMASATMFVQLIICGKWSLIIIMLLLGKIVTGNLHRGIQLLDT